MKVIFSQIYIEPGVNFPFNHLFQRRLSDEITSLVEPSTEFVEKWGSDFDLIFRISAKKSIQDNELKGPTIFKKTKDLEFTIFLPFDVVSCQVDPPKSALSYLFKGINSVFSQLQINSSKLYDKENKIADDLLKDSSL